MASKLWVVFALVATVALGRVAEASVYPLTGILGDKEAALLAKQDIADTQQLLKRAATPTARAKLARATGLEVKRLRTWAKMCDLLRIRGVGPQMVKLFNMVGITTIKKLRAHRPIPLAQTIRLANKRDKVTETPPNAEQLRNWIGQAKKFKIILK